MQTCSKCRSANLVLAMPAAPIYMQEPTGELDDNGYTHVAEQAEWYRRDCKNTWYEWSTKRKNTSDLNKGARESLTTYSSAYLASQDPSIARETYCHKVNTTYIVVRLTPQYMVLTDRQVARESTGVHVLYILQSTTNIYN